MVHMCGEEVRKMKWRRGGVGVVEVEVMKRVVRGLFFPKSLFSARRDLLG